MNYYLKPCTLTGEYIKVNKYDVKRDGIKEDELVDFIISETEKNKHIYILENELCDYLSLNASVFEDVVMRHDQKIDDFETQIESLNEEIESLQRELSTMIKPGRYTTIPTLKTQEQEREWDIVIDEFCKKFNMGLVRDEVYYKEE
jgi:hypothetical protein